MNPYNYTMLCDYYELTMGNGYFVSGMKDKISYFDLFFATCPTRVALPSAADFRR